MQNSKISGLLDENAPIVLSIISFVTLALTGFDWPFKASIYHPQSTEPLPFDSTRFSAEVLAQDKNEPMKLAVVPLTGSLITVKTP